MVVPETLDDPRSLVGTHEASMMDSLGGNGSAPGPAAGPRHPVQGAEARIGPRFGPGTCVRDRLRAWEEGRSGAGCNPRSGKPFPARY